MKTDNHKCAIPSCDREISYQYLMCKPHWARVPMPMRSTVYRRWRDAERHPESERFWTAYLNAREAAIAAVTEKESVHV